MTEKDQSDILLNELVKNSCDALSDGELTFGEVVRLGGLLAGKVNPFEQFSGIQKRELVVKAVEIALNEILAQKKASLSEDQYSEFCKKIEMAVSFARETLPSVLDLAVDAARGKLDLKKTQKTCWSLLSFVLHCSVRQEPQLPTKEKDDSKDLKQNSNVVSDQKQVHEKIDCPSEEKSAEVEIREAIPPSG